MEVNPNAHFHKCGLVINNSMAFLGASPDGIVCENGESAIVEVKCPYNARHGTIKEGVQNGLIPYLDDKLQLKTDAGYYCQVQGQLMITGCKCCLFIVYTPMDIHWQRISADTDFMATMLLKLATFFHQHAHKYIQDNLT